MNEILGKLCGMVIIIICITGCNKDKTSSPGITVMSDNLVDGTIEAGENQIIKFTIDIDAPGGLQSIRVSFDGITKNDDDILVPEPGALTFKGNYELENWLYNTSAFRIVFTAVDAENNSSQAEVLIQPGLPGIEIFENNDVIDNTLVAFVGQLYKVEYRYTFPAGFVSFRNTFFVDGQKESESLVTSLPPTQGTSVTDQINQALGVEFLGKELNYAMEITDKFGEKTTMTLPVELTQKPTALYNSKKMEVPASDGSVLTFFSTNTGVVYSADEITQSPELAAFIDFGYYYDVTDLASLSGPNTYPTFIYNIGPNGDNWNQLNFTNFKVSTISVSEFDALDENSMEELIAAYESASGSALLIIKNLSVNDVIAFKTSSTKISGSKFGLLKVVSIVPGGTGVGSIIIDVIANQ